MRTSSHGLAPLWPDRLATLARSRRRGGRRSRLLRRSMAAALLIAAGVIAITGRQGQPVGVRVLAVAHDLPVGAELTTKDLLAVTIQTAPDGALRRPDEAVGRRLSAPVRRGEILTDIRLVSPDGPDPGPGRVAVPVRPADPATVDLLSVGMHVAVLTVASTGVATLLATDAVVLGVPPPSKADPSRRLVVLAVPSSAADRITATGIAGTVALRFT